MTTTNGSADSSNSNAHAAGTTWGNRRVRLVAAKPSLAQAPPKKSAAMASREAIRHPMVNSSSATDMQVLPLATATSPDAPEATTTAAAAKRPPVSAPAALQRHRSLSDAAATTTTTTAHDSMTTQLQLKYAPLAVRPLAAMALHAHTSAPGTSTECPGSSDGHRDATAGRPCEQRASSPDCAAPTSTPFNANDGRPGLWARRSSLVTKKSGEVVKPSLKIKTRGMKPRSKSEPTTPTKFVHFDAQICRVRFFRHVESPRSVAGTESEGENTESQDSDSDSGPGAGARLVRRPASAMRGHARAVDPFDQVNRAVEEAQGLRSGQYRLQLVNLPDTSVFHLTMRPISVEWIRLGEQARHLRVLTCCQNLAFHKMVTIRYTRDNWRTHDDVVSEFYDSISNGGFDRFLATIPIQHWLLAMASGDATMTPLVIELCVRYVVDGKEFWDNNRGSNYRVIVSREPAATYSHDYFSLSSSSTDPLPSSSTSERNARALQQEAEKTWQQVLMKSRANDDDDDEEDDGDDERPRHQQPHRHRRPQSQQDRTGMLASTDDGSSGQSPDHWMVAAPRKPAKKNGSFAGRYDFGASLKAATRSSQRRPLRRTTSSSEEEEMAAITTTTTTTTMTTTVKTQIGFTLPAAPTTTDAGTKTTAAASGTAAPAMPKSTSALSRAISVSKPLAGSPVVTTTPSVTATATASTGNGDVNTSLALPALPWSRSHSPGASSTGFSQSTATGAIGTIGTSPVSPRFSNKSLLGQLASSPSVQSLDEASRPAPTATSTSTAASIPVAIAASSPATAAAAAAMPYTTSTPYHSMMMASFATSPNFGGASFGFYGHHQPFGSGSYNSNAAHFGHHAINDYYGGGKDELAAPSPYDATSAALPSPKTSSASFLRGPHGFYPHHASPANHHGSPMAAGSGNGLHRRNSSHPTSPFSDSPLSSPSTTPLPWIRGR